MIVEYTRGLHPVGAETYAYLMPPGTWGLSNCGLVVGDGAGLLVDTQFDLAMTRDLAAEIRARRPDVTVTTVVTTHANGDHCWGNQVYADAELISSVACAHGLGEEVQPAQLAALSGPDGPDSPLGDYLRRHFGRFDFSGVAVPEPARTFSGRLDVRVGGRTVELIEVGPAHTSGDVVVHVPDAGVVFAGDILFVGDHPIMWAGPIGNWVAACELILATGADRFVPGHGPVTDPAGVRLFRDYLTVVAERAESAFAAGLPYREAADFPLPDAFRPWGRAERLVITMAAAYRHLGAPDDDLLTVLAHTADRDRELA